MRLGCPAAQAWRPVVPAATAPLQFQKKATRSKGDRGQKKELGALYDGAQIVQVRGWVVRRVGKQSRLTNEFPTDVPSRAITLL